MDYQIPCIDDSASRKRRIQELELLLSLWQEEEECEVEEAAENAEKKTREKKRKVDSQQSFWAVMLR